MAVLFAKDKNKALLEAIQASNRELARELLQKGANIDSRDESGLTPLLKASFSGKANVVKFILALNPNVNERDSRGITSLAGAALAGRSGHDDVSTATKEDAQLMEYSLII